MVAEGNRVPIGPRDGDGELSVVKGSAGYASANAQPLLLRVSCRGYLGQWAVLKWGGLLKVEISMTTLRRKFTQEFNDELCREVISTSKPIEDVATAYVIGPETLHLRLNKHREANRRTEAAIPFTYPPAQKNLPLPRSTRA